MEDKPRKRGRQPKAAKEANREQTEGTNSSGDVVADPIKPAAELLKSKGEKRAAVVPVVPKETKEVKKKAKISKSTEIASESKENGLHETEVPAVDVEMKPKARKGRAKKMDPPAEEQPLQDDKELKTKRGKTVPKNSEGKKPARASKTKPAVEPENEAPSVVEETLPTVTKRGRAKQATKPTEAEEPINVPKPKGRGRPKAKLDNDGDGGSVAELDVKDVQIKQPAIAETYARGKKKLSTIEEIPVVAPEAPVKAQAKRGGSRKAVVPSEANGVKEEIPVETKAEAAAIKANGVTHRKRGKATSDDAGEDTESLGAPPKEKKSKVAAPKMNKAATDYGSINFAIEDAKPWNFKISTWNVAGLRSWVGKGGLDFVNYEQPDILCVQETKCTEDKLPDEARHLKGYHPYWLCQPGGYAGVAIYSKKMPIHVTYGLGDTEQDADGRLLTAEYEKFYLVCVYVPNAGNKLVTLPKRMRWDTKFHALLRELDAKKPVILCGDMNVAHEEIDLANPKTNRKNAGFTQEERDGMTSLLSFGFVDTFRRLYPERKSAYTFWTYMGGARAKNVGWRLDYFILSERLADKVTDNVIRSQVHGSDHCPLTLFLNL